MQKKPDNKATIAITFITSVAELVALFGPDSASNAQVIAAIICIGIVCGLAVAGVSASTLMALSAGLHYVADEIDEMVEKITDEKEPT